MVIAFGYASTMPLGPESVEKLSVLGIEASWIGISLLFFISGMLGQRSLHRHGSPVKYLQSRIFRNAPLLVIITLVTVLVLLPIFGKPHGDFANALKTAALYFFGTITCINPGAPLPGLLDDAKYMCLIQGAIWTLKWGLLAHIAVAAGHMVKLYSRPSMTLALAIVALLGYFFVIQISVSTSLVLPEALSIATRLAWPFLLGMAIYSYWDKISLSAVKIIASAVVFFAAAILARNFLPDSAGTDMFLSLAWFVIVVSCLKLKTESVSFLNNWPALALAVYLINWPTSQMLLLAFPEIGAWGLIATSLPITLAISWLAHKLITQRNFEFAKSRVYAGQPA